jgi:HAMP domain-containing protein
LLLAVQEPSVRRGLQQALGLPNEPIAEALRELAAAQARTDAEVKQLATEVKQLATEVKQLAAELRQQAATHASEMREVRRALGVLSDNVGFGLEELAAIVLPGVLERDEHVLLAGPFERRSVQTPAGLEEVDLHAAAEREGEPVGVVVEVKSKLYEADVRRFGAKASRLAEALGESIVPVLFGFVIHPSARAAAGSLGVCVVASRPGNG